MRLYKIVWSFSKIWAPFIPIRKICNGPNLIYTPFNFSIVTFEGLDCPPVFGYIVSWRVSWAYVSKLNPTTTKQWIVQQFPTTICLSFCSPTPLSWSIGIVTIYLFPHSCIFIYRHSWCFKTPIHKATLFILHSKKILHRIFLNYCGISLRVIILWITHWMIFILELWRAELNKCLLMLYIFQYVD